MKRVILVSIILFFLLISPLIGFADPLPGGGSGPYYLNTNPSSNSKSSSESVRINNPLTSNTFFDLIGKLIDFAFYLSLGIAPIMIIIAGFYFITAQGEAQKIKLAREMIVWSLIGVLIIFSAKAIIVFFLKVIK